MPYKDIEQARRYAATHREEARQTARAWYYAHLEVAREYRRVYSHTHREVSRRASAKYRQSHGDQVCAAGRLYIRQHRQERSSYAARVYREDNEYRLRSILRSRLYRAIRYQSKAGSAVKDLGCSIKELKAHLESLFLPGMTWNNWGRDGWHIDHIRPLASFDLTDRVQLLRACHFTNLQPLWANDNQRKRAKCST